jgi:hypothetical protein
LAGFVAGIAIVALCIGSGWALFATTETRCWTAYRTPEGIECRTTPEFERGEIHVGEESIGGGCEGGVLTPRGAALAGLLGIGAVTLSALASRSASQR